MESNVVKSKSKRDVDFEKAVAIRKETARHLNLFLTKEKTDLYFSRLSKHPIRMNIAEKNKNNKLQNRIQEAPKKKSMGLYYALKYKDNKYPGQINFIFAYSDQGSFYLKLPKEYRNDPGGYVKLLAELNWYVLVIDGRTYSSPISMQLVEQFWKRAISKSKGNKNRLQFYIPLQRVRCRKLTEGDGLFEERTVIQELKELIK